MNDAVDALPEVSETEPNDHLTAANNIAQSAIVNERLDPAFIERSANKRLNQSPSGSFQAGKRLPRNISFR